MQNQTITGKEVGTVYVSMYEESETGLPIFRIQPENRHLVPICRTIANALKKKTK